jgi:hypothetical protein
MSIPIIFIHNGDQDYFKTVFKQACKQNAYVFVLGTREKTPMAHFDTEPYFELAGEFAKHYEHLSTNGHEVELMCFQRWFILQDFMVKHDMDRCFHLDSDTMLYANVDEEYPKYEQFDFTLSHRCCGNGCFFTLKGLSEFCNFLLNFYKNKNTYEYERVTAHYHIRQKHGLDGGVCDMTLLEFYSYKHCGKIGEMMHILDGAVYDHNINETDQYFNMSPNGIKDIFFVDGKPFCGQKILGRDIQFKTLHFQGSAKRFIPEFLNAGC